MGTILNCQGYEKKQDVGQGQNHGQISEIEPVHLSLRNAFLVTNWLGGAGKGIDNGTRPTSPPALITARRFPCSRIKSGQLTSLLGHWHCDPEKVVANMTSLPETHASATHASAVAVGNQEMGVIVQSTSLALDTDATVSADYTVLTDTYRDSLFIKLELLDNLLVACALWEDASGASYLSHLEGDGASDASKSVKLVEDALAALAPWYEAKAAAAHHRPSPSLMIVKAVAIEVVEQEEGGAGDAKHAREEAMPMPGEAKRRWMCDECGRTFCRRTNRNRHRKAVHAKSPKL